MCMHAPARVAGGFVQCTDNVTAWRIVTASIIDRLTELRTAVIYEPADTHCVHSGRRLYETLSPASVCSPLHVPREAGLGSSITVLEFDQNSVALAMDLASRRPGLDLNTAQAHRCHPVFLGSPEPNKSYSTSFCLFHCR